MKERALIFSTVLVCMFAFSVIQGVLAAAKTQNLVIHTEATEQGLQDGTYDVLGWPLAKEWVDAWALIPDQIVLRDYVELGMVQIDLNNQKWPTGDNSPNKFYDKSEKDNKTVEFRKAIVCLTDRDKIVSDILNGYGFRMDVPMPPFQSAYIDLANYTASGLIYNYNKTRAEQILSNAGFTVGSDGWRIDPYTGSKLADLIFYVRQDDPIRKQVGEMLVDELKGVGIPVRVPFFWREFYYKEVMVSYDYHLYTGGWSLSTIPDQYYDLYSSYTYYGPLIGWSQNYPGFCNAEFDAHAFKVKYAGLPPFAEAKECGYLFLKYCAVVPLYCWKAVKAYKLGWIGMVNNGGSGVDNYYSFLNMYKTGDDTIDYGLRGGVNNLNIITNGIGSERSTHVPDCSETPKVLSLIYESMLGRNPFNLAPSEFWIASSYTVGSWDASSGGGDSDATYIAFALKNNVTFHNITGNPRKPVTALDVNFSFYFTYQCGPGVAWNFPMLAQFNKTVVVDATHISIYYNKKSTRAVEWAGELPIVNEGIWGRLTPGNAVRLFDPAKSDVNGNGIADIKEDGTGAWQFVEQTPRIKPIPVPLQEDPIVLVRDDNYYLGSIDIENRLKEMFHIGAGDVNRDGIVSQYDLGYMARSLGTNSSFPHGIGWGMYNPDCDLNSDGYVNVLDMATVTSHYGQTMG